MTGAGSLRPLFQPETVALIGASASADKAGNAMLRSLSSLGDRLFAVNPRGGSLGGRPAYPAVGDIEADIDLAVLAVPAPACPESLIACGKAGVRAAVICAGGFAETGPAGQLLQAEVTAIARRYGIRLLGPNTSGFISPAAGLTVNFVTDAVGLPPGPAAIVAQSGGINLALCFLAAGSGLGVRLGVGLGNAADVGFVDVLDYLAADEGTTAVGMHVEGVGDGRALAAAVRRLAARKPVVALPVGRAGAAEFARSHTGALAGSHELACASLAQAGAVLADDLTGLVDALKALAAGRADPAPRLRAGVITGQAGPGLLIADVLHAAGLELAVLSPATRARIASLLPPLTYQGNPVDTGRPGDTFPAVLTAVADDPDVGVLLVYALSEPDAIEPKAAVAGVAGALPVVYACGGQLAAVERTAAELAGLGIPVFPAPDRGARAVAAVIRDAAAQFRIRRGPPIELQALAQAARLPGREPLDEDQAKAVLGAAGLATPARRACPSRAAAHAALAELGMPVVVKVLDPGISHKSDVGGVHLGIASARALDQALDAIDAIGGPAARGYLVEQQAGPGADLILGGVRDPAYGPAVLLGLGGTAVELAGRRVIRLAPLSEADAREMTASLPAGLLAGHRGLPPVRPDDVVAALLAVSRLMMAYPGLRELDINPMRFTAAGPLALDALLVPAEAKVDMHES